MKRALLMFTGLAGLATLLTLILVKGLTSEEPITILKARVIPLHVPFHVPDNNRDRPFTQEDVHLLHVPPETPAVVGRARVCTPGIGGDCREEARFALSIRHAQRLDKGQDPKVEGREPIPREALRKTGGG
jgi:hypothetical protein